MTTFREVTEAWIASREHCAGSLGRIQFLLSIPVLMCPRVSWCDCQQELLYPEFVLKGGRVTKET